MNTTAYVGYPEIDQVIAAVIHGCRQQLPALHLSWYLHGSWATGSAHPTSDVDILALTPQPVSRVDQDAVRAIAERLAIQRGVPLDVHLLALDTLIHDPWVDLSRTGRLLAGPDLRPLVPPPSLDALAREAVLMVCLDATDSRTTVPLPWPFSHPQEDDPFFGRLHAGGPRGLAKALTWLTSARLASRYGYVPTSASDARHTFAQSDDPDARWLSESIALCYAWHERPVDSGATGQLRALCEYTRTYENSTFAALHTAIQQTQRLGERCAAVLYRYIRFPTG